MSAYRGWDPEELRKAGEVTREASTVVQTPVEFGPASFTPINHKQESTPSNLRGFSINSDALYDLPEDNTLPDPAAQLPKKRGRKPTAKVTKARSVNLGQVWEYEDKGDSPQQGDSPAPKRRKSAPVKHNRAVKKNQKQDDQNESTQDDGIYGDSGGMQLTTPPDTTSRTRRGVGSDAQGKHGQLFRGSTITKPITTKTKGLEHPLKSSPIIKHTGWTTTEITVKSSPIVPSKTTLEKLYKTPLTLGFDLPEVKTSSHTPKQTSVQPALVLSDYGVPSADSRFKDISCSSGDAVAPLPRDPIQGYDKTSAETYPTAASDAYGCQVDQDAAVENCMTSIEESILYHLSDSFRNDSGGVQDVVGAHQQEPYDSLNDPTRSRSLHLSGCDQAYDEYADEQYAQEEYGAPPDDLSQNYPDFLASDLNYFPVDAESLRVSNRNDIIRHSSPQAQVPNSELPHLQSTEPSVPKETTRAFSASDEFDEEGIQDEDLLAFVSDAVIPETSSTSYTRWEPLEGSSPSKFLPRTPCPVASKVNCRLLSPAMIVDDDFPDSDVKDGMLNLPGLGNEVKETKAPPASVAKEYVIDDDSVNEEVYDSTLKFSPLKTHDLENQRDCVCGVCDGKNCRVGDDNDGPEKLLIEAEDWSFIRTDDGSQDRGDPLGEEASPAPRVDMPARPRNQRESHSSPDSVMVMSSHVPQIPSKDSSLRKTVILDDSHEYLPLQPFARPDFPRLIRDRSPILGLSGQTVLRTCFRIGEMLKEGGRCDAVNQDALIELFARVTFSSRDSGTARQHFQFADLFHDRPPFPNGVLENFKTSGLVESESRVLLDVSEEHMARALGRLQKDIKNACWVLSILSIRKTDWEEVRWTKRIVSANQTKSEKGIVAPKL